MKKVAVLCVFLLAAVGVNAQIETPQPSPMAKVEQVIGLTNASIEYSRPAMRGRDIFGDLVPYDQLWRTGANANTIVSFDNDVKVGGKELKAGSYALFTKPGKRSWEVIFYTDTSNWGTPREWDDSKVAATIMADVMKMNDATESWSISFENLTNDGAHLVMKWAKVQVNVPITVPTQTTAMASIERVMAGPAANDYYNAASYYLDANTDLEKAHMWIKKATEMRGDAFWYWRRRSLIEAQLGKTTEAINSAKTSLRLAKAAGNGDYVKMNEDSLKEWGAM